MGALSLRSLVLEVVVVPNAHLKGLLHPLNREEGTKVVEAGDRNHRQEGSVEAMLVVAVEECHISSNMVALVSIKLEVGAGHLSKEGEEDMVVVVVVDVEDLLSVAHQDHQLPSCTKLLQPRINLWSTLNLFHQSLVL